MSQVFPNVFMNGACRNRHRSGWRQRGACGVAIACLLICGLVARAADPAPDVAPPQDEVVTSNGVNIHFTYYPSKAGKEAPVVLLLHMKDSNRFVWKNGLAERLQRANYAVVAVDLRGHGESRLGAGGVGALPGGNPNQPDDKSKGRKTGGLKLKAADYQAMVNDLDTIKREFLLKEHRAMRLNVARMGIIGAEMGATVAAQYALYDWSLKPYEDGPTLATRTPRGQDVKALVLISPQRAFEGLNTIAPLQTLREPAWNLSFLVCWGKNDPQDKGQGMAIYKSLQPAAKNEKRIFHKEYPKKLRGTDLLGQESGDLEARIELLLKRSIGGGDGPDVPWRDRRPVYDRK